VITGRPALTCNAWLRWGWIERGLRSLPRGARLLEIGVGQGAASARLAERFTYLGVEADAEAAAVSSPRIIANGGTLLVGRAEEVLDAEPHDVLVAFEVLEHIEDDVAALRSWSRWVRPGGRLVLSVPARPERFGRWDAAVGHYRRYTRDSLAAAVAAADLELVALWSYGWPLGYVLEAVRNRLADRASQDDGSMDDRTAASGRALQPSGRAGVVTWLATLPFRAIQIPLSGTDVGTGLVVVARRPLANP
jgi:2-polyprenyl-3-methyl-5-hydroxy-6-metoxy-1,4-benzoquinol methylase